MIVLKDSAQLTRSDTRESSNYYDQENNSSHSSARQSKYPKIKTRSGSSSEGLYENLIFIKIF